MPPRETLSLAHAFARWWFFRPPNPRTIQQLQQLVEVALRELPVAAPINHQHHLRTLEAYARPHPDDTNLRDHGERLVRERKWGLVGYAVAGLLVEAALACGRAEGRGEFTRIHTDETPDPLPCKPRVIVEPVGGEPQDEGVHADVRDGLADVEGQ